MATDFECPAWLNEDFLARVYENAEPAVSSTNITNCGSVVGLGENYASQLFRVTVQVTETGGSTREDSLVIKSLENTDVRMKDHGVYTIEAEMYGSVLKKFEGYFQEQGQAVEFGPKCFMVSSKPFDVIVLSDLKVGGYAMEDRFVRLDIEHAKLVLSTLAKFHAAGCLYLEKEGSVPKNLEGKYIDKNMARLFFGGLDMTVSILVDKMKEMGMDQSYIDKVQKWEASAFPSMIRATDPDFYPSDFHTILHGDLWVNNQMFRYNEQKQLEDVKFVDFQFSYYGNPMCDLIYFMFTSLKPELVVEHLDDLVAYYHAQLVNAMAVLKVTTNPPSLDQLQIQLQRAGPFVSGIILVVLAGTLMDRTEILKDFQEKIIDPDFVIKMRRLMVNNSRYETCLKTFLPFCDKRGYLGSQLTASDLPDEFKGFFDKQPPQPEVATPTATEAADKTEAPQATTEVTETSEPVVKASAVDLPPWLNLEFVKDVLSTTREVTISECSPVVDVGDNYVSKMYRVKVNIKEESEVQRSLVIKSLENIDPVFLTFGVFTTEKDMYVNVLPALKEIWGGAGESIDFAPGCLRATEKPHELIVLEDLQMSGYKMADRFEKLDLKHGMLTLSKLAKFHAAASYKEKNGGVGTHISRKPMDKALIKQFHPLSLNKIGACLKVIRTLGLEKEIVEKCENWLNGDPLEICRMTDTDQLPGYFLSIVHSDCWMNNIMYKYNDKKEVEDLLFIDFQMSFWGNPLLDVIYFLFSSLQHNILVEKFEDLFKHYCDELVKASTLLGLGEKAPTFAQLSDQLKKCGHYASMILTEIVPIVVMERHSDANIGSFMDSDSEAARNLQDKMYHNPKYQEILKALLPFMNKMGFLDVPCVVAKEPKDNGNRQVSFENSEPAEKEAETPSFAPAVIHSEVIVPISEPLTNGSHIEVVEENEPVRVIIQEAKPTRPRIKSRIEETINKFAALEANGSASSFVPNNRASATPPGFPKWLDKFYFYDLLRKEYNSFKIFKFNVEPANGKGENYATMMFRVKLSIEANSTGLVNRSFMVKVNHDSGPALEILSMINLFPKEIEMYNSFYPKFEAIFRAAGHEVRLGAKCILGTRDPNDLIILEDLSLEGYKCADRRKGLDLDHVHLTIQKLAKMHAASVVYIEQGGKFDEKYDEGIMSKKMIPFMDEFIQGNMDVMKTVTDDWSCGKTMKSFYENWKDLFKKSYSSFDRDDTRFNVLNHGDMWSNNIMYKYDNGKVEECLLVDLQLCHYNSPVHDLYYFMVSSLHKDLRVKKIDYILQFYHQELLSNLKILGCKKKPPTLLELQKDFLALGSIGWGTAFGTLAVVVAPPNDEADINTFLGDSEKAVEFKRNLYANPLYREAMEEWIPYFERKGYFEV